MRLLTDEQHAQIAAALKQSIAVPCYGGHPTQEAALATLTAAPSVEVVAWRTIESDEKKPKRLDKWFYAENKAYTEIHKFKWTPLYAIKKETP